ncbi:hypothetical protein GR7B_00238 [Vibrio phage vB_VcorM_GR7B]|nr:hypothetical protein GR7B_00238 [Vibrio phage vB_VcorM_GR7B]
MLSEICSNDVGEIALFVPIALVIFAVGLGKVMDWVYNTLYWLFHRD